MGGFWRLGEALGRLREALGSWRLREACGGFWRLGEALGRPWGAGGLWRLVGASGGLGRPWGDLGEALGDCCEVYGGKCWFRGSLTKKVQKRNKFAKFNECIHVYINNLGAWAGLGKNTSKNTMHHMLSV